MKREKVEVVRGSGNVFRDLEHKNADVSQFKGILAAEIIKPLDRERLTVRAAQARTGVAAADFSRIRNANLGRFTVDRLMAIINRLGSRVEVKVRVHRGEAVGQEAREVLGPEAGHAVSSLESPAPSPENPVLPPENPQGCGLQRKSCNLGSLGSNMPYGVPK
jgi:predicted XRE-type DNA-binding protein